MWLRIGNSRCCRSDLARVFCDLLPGSESQKNVDVTAYLRRIGYDDSLEPSLRSLRALHLAHLRTVPFENLDLHWGRTIVLDEDLLYGKVVGENRGGFCYELNGLFAALLRELGYKVTLLSARVAGKQHKLGPPFDHLTLRVELDGPWLADVGFGDSFLQPLRWLRGYEELQGRAVYRLEENERGRWALLRRQVTDGDWQLQYVFTLAPRKLSDFAEMCAWQQTSPESHFTRARVCTRVTEHGRITLSDTRLIVTEGSERTEREVGENERRELLQKAFGIRDQGRESAAGH